MSIENEAIKTMVSLSDTIEEADDIIVEFTPHRTFADKLKYLSAEFPSVSIIGGYDGKDGNPEQTDYEAVLSAIINLKWR